MSSASDVTCASFLRLASAGGSAIIGATMTDDREIIESFTEGRPAAAQWMEWRDCLKQRLDALLAERRAAGPEASPKLDERIRQLRRQIAALTEEAAISEFVEDSVRVTLALGPSAAGAHDPAYE